MARDRSVDSGHTATKAGQGAADGGMNVEAAYLDALPKLRRYVRRLLGAGNDGAEVDDVMQETYVRAYAAKREQKLTHATAYVYRVARNLSFKARARQQSPVIQLVEDFAAEGIIDDVVPPPEQLHQKRRLAVFEEAVSRLPPQCRQVFVLRQVDGLTHREISRRLGISTSTVEKHLAKGLKLCANFMRDQGYETAREESRAALAEPTQGYAKYAQVKD
ncbi:MAG: hypothetical protein Tsb0016_06830 [Sphingomonadales bacterium]